MKTIEEIMHAKAAELCDAWGMRDGNGYSVKDTYKTGFIQGAQWQQQQSPWVAVADQEPEEFKNVLLAAGSLPSVFVGYFNGEDFVVGNTGEIVEYFRVMHWMEIPA